MRTRINPLRPPFDFQGESGSGLTTDQLDTRYLKLDGSNNPITGDLVLNQGLIVNETGGDFDFRVESDTNAHALFVNAENSRVGINNPNPQSDLDVIGTFRFSDAATPTKGVRYRFGGATDVEGAGADMYFSVWQNGDFSGNQRTKMVMESGSDVLQLVKDVQFRNNPHGDTYHSISGQGGAVFNEIGGNNDFRIEGDTDENLFFVDASADRVGIGTNSPNEKLDVAGTARVDGLRIDQTPTSESIVPTHSVTINLNGTNYKFAVQVA